MKTLNKYILVLVIVLFANLTYSQQCDKFSQHKEKMEAEKVAFITKKLDLSVDEAQKFWPVYNEMQDKKTALHKQKRTLMQKFHKGFETMSDSQIEKGLDKSLNIDLEIDKMRIEYNTKFKKAIGIKKTALFYESEREFRKTLLRDIKKRHCEK